MLNTNFSTLITAESREGRRLGGDGKEALRWNVANTIKGRRETAVIWLRMVMHGCGLHVTLNSCDNLILVISFEGCNVGIGVYTYWGRCGSIEGSLIEKKCKIFVL